MKKIINKLRDSKIKVTPQRVAIFKFLDDNKNHPTAEDTFKYVSIANPGISLATVYNTLEKMFEVGAINKVHIDAGKIHYDPGLIPHHHFLCERCKSIYDIFLDCSVTKQGSIEGHQVLETHGYFKGVCKKCLNKKEGGAGQKI